MGVGQLSPKAKKLTSVAREAFFQAAKIIKPGVTTGDIGNAIQVFVEANGYNVVRALVGHGVGRQVHEEPKLPNYGTPGTGMKLPVGVVLAIEPMVVEGHYQVVTAKDNWTVITADSGLAAHYEHTVLVTENGCEIITKL
jgi:methionyl aminopeptidase